MKDQTKENIKAMTAASCAASDAYIYQETPKIVDKNYVEDDGLVKCPYCKKSYYSQSGFSTATCMGYSRVFKDGKEISFDPNYYSTQCHCLECGKDFVLVTHAGKTYTQ